MFELVKSISFNTKVTVCGVLHTAKAKTLYLTENETEKWYAKIVFEDHSILVIAPYDDFMYFGRINNVFGDGKAFPEKLTYLGNTFNKVAQDYQIVKELVFGDPLFAEGEVIYADYSSETDVLISLAIVSRTGLRADVIAKVITNNDIKVEGI